MLTYFPAPLVSLSVEKVFAIKCRTPKNEQRETNYFYNELFFENVTITKTYFTYGCKVVIISINPFLIMSKTVQKH